MAVSSQEITDRYALYNGDACDVLPTLPDGCLGMSLHSPPFWSLFHYSSSERDMSNARTYEEFFEHYAFVVRQLSRLTPPGRIAAVHACDVPLDGANYCGYRDFPGRVIRLYEENGFDYLPRICVWKEPLGVRLRTMSKALAHWAVVEDSTLTTVAAADYVLPFRKKGVNAVPVSHPVGLTSYAGAREVPKELLAYRGYQGKQTENRYSHWVWRQYASAFWDDVRIDRVLPFEAARDDQDERHVHPLQLDVVERCVILWSNPGEVVLSPFCGVGSEVYGAVSLGRRGVGVELKEAYYRQAAANVRSAAEDAPQQADLFSALGDAESPESAEAS